MTGHLLVGLPVTTPVQTACDLLQQGRHGTQIEAVLSACVDDGHFDRDSAVAPLATWPCIGRVDARVTAPS